MPSNYDPSDDRPRNAGRAGAGPENGGLPPELDPRRRRPPIRRGVAGPPASAASKPAAQQPAPSGARAALPPELDPRGPRAGRAGQGGQGVGRASTTAGAAAGAGFGKPRRRSDAVRGAVLGIKVLAGVLSLLVLVGSGFAWATYRSFTGNIIRVNAITPTSDTPGNPANAGGIDGLDQNILMVGNDDRDSASDAELAQLGTTRDGGSYNTDTMMLLHLPANGAKATAISFPRDSYVTIPGHGKNKLNAAYPIGVAAAHGDKAAGARLLVQTIEAMTGLHIDHFVQVDLIGFYRISTAIGGVNLCLNRAMGPATHGQIGVGYDSGIEADGTFVPDYSGINLKAGVNKNVMGKQALAFVRQRHGFPDGQGDLDRIKRQQYFLSAVFRKISSAGTLLNPLKLQSLLKAVSTSLQMDNSLDPAKLAQQMQNLQAGNFTFTTIPTAGFADEVIDGTTQSTVAVDAGAMKDFVDNLIGDGPATALKNATAASPKSVTVQVINDTNNDGVATTNALALQQAGFKTSIPPATTDLLPKTTIRYAPGQESAVKALQAQVPGAVLVRSSEVAGVALVLGENNVQVKSLMPKPSKTPSASSSASSSGSSGSAGSAGSAGAVSAPATTTAADAGCID